MRCLLSGNDFCGGPEAMRCHAHPVNRLILSGHYRRHCVYRDRCQGGDADDTCPRQEVPENLGGKQG